MKDAQINKNSSNDIRLSSDYSVTYIDTDRVDEIKRDLIKYVNEYANLITKLFNRFRDVPYVSKEWVGNQAEFYFSSIMKDKVKFLNFGNNLRNITNKLDSDLNIITSNVTKLTRLEGEARYHDQI